MDTIHDLEWMSLIPHALRIGTTTTGWPGTVPSPIAMIDTGGGPVFLSDPNGYLYPSTWPLAVSCPAWSNTSELCECTRDDLTITLADAATSYSYLLDTGQMPTSVQGLTLVMCKRNIYMRGQEGMNIGGVSALFNRICIDYSSGQVGMKPR